MFCSNCKNQIVEGAKFCMSCGAPVVVKAFCMGCGTELTPEAKFCPSCGKSTSAAPPSAKTEASNDALTFYNQGLEYFNQEDYGRAIESYEKSIQIGLLNPNDSDMYFNLGVAYTEIGNYVRAIECFEKTVRIDPNNSGAYHNLACVYEILEDFDKLVENLRESVRLGNEDSQQWLIDNEQWLIENGYSDRNTVTENESPPDDESNSLYALGDEHYDRKDFAKAIEFYEKANSIARAGNPSALFFRLGYAYAEIGKFEQAIEWYEKFIKEFPDHEDAKIVHNNLGYAYGKLENYDKQVENYREGARLGYEGSQQWLSSKMRGYTENDLVIKTMRAEGIDPENAEDRVWGVYNRRFIFKEGKCMRCGGKLTLLRKCKSCGASAFEGTM